MGGHQHPRADEPPTAKTRGVERSLHRENRPPAASSQFLNIRRPHGPCAGQQGCHIRERSVRVILCRHPSAPSSYVAHAEPHVARRSPAGAPTASATRRQLPVARSRGASAARRRDAPARANGSAASMLSMTLRFNSDGWVQFGCLRPCAKSTNAHAKATACSSASTSSDPCLRKG
jgi:hypothetical protein